MKKSGQNGKKKEMKKGWEKKCEKDVEKRFNRFSY